MYDIIAFYFTGCVAQDKLNMHQLEATSGSRITTKYSQYFRERREEHSIPIIAKALRYPIGPMLARRGLHTKRREAKYSLPGERARKVND